MREEKQYQRNCITKIKERTNERITGHLRNSSITGTPSSSFSIASFVDSANIHKMTGAYVVLSRCWCYKGEKTNILPGFHDEGDNCKHLITTVIFFS